MSDLPTQIADLTESISDLSYLIGTELTDRNYARTLMYHSSLQSKMTELSLLLSNYIMGIENDNRDGVTGLFRPTTREIHHATLYAFENGTPDHLDHVNHPGLLREIAKIKEEMEKWGTFENMIREGED